MEPSTTSAAESIPAFVSVRIAPTNREPFEFSGCLLAESIGEESSGGEALAFHSLRVYQVEADGIMVVIEFHGHDVAFVEAELVSSLDEVDDFFSIYAADCFQEFCPSVAHPGFSEQEAVRKFEAQTAVILEELAKFATNSPMVAAASPLAGLAGSTKQVTQEELQPGANLGQ
ncbi:MAG: hypothetical protein R3C18_16820 [Planctomycetaceae bacterium]